MPASAAERAVRAAFAEQADWCSTLDSPLTAQVCALIAEQAWPDGAVATRLRSWSGDPRASADALPLRLCGGLHAAVRSGNAPLLAGAYPPNPLPDPAEMWPRLGVALAMPKLAEWLDSPPQTNEVGRASALVSGLLAFSARYQAPIDLLELGASAGLNLQLDRFRYTLGQHHTGDIQSPLHLTPEWHGSSPPAGPMTIVSRAGVDRSPLDPTQDADRLLAFVWADQDQRLRQLEAALSIAIHHRLQVETGDAALWLEQRLSSPSRPGTGRVVMHSIAFQYFSRVTQARVRSAIEQAGRRVSRETPLGWLRFERDGPDRDAYLRLRTWPDGEDRLLARCHPHGASINWLDDPAR